MKKGVAVLLPYLEEEKKLSGNTAKNAGKILLATVKGDVHDIGKNIVGVVLACNNYEIIDVGVMVPCEKILQVAVEQNVDIIGLSGLITPSLDEMVYVAKEMQRLGMKLPLLIGGATTSRIHTAVKIDPMYDGAVVHVLDASKGVPVASSLLGKDQKEIFTQKMKDEYIQMRADYANKKEDKNYIPYEQAQRNKLKIDWTSYHPKTPSFIGNKVFKNIPLEDIRPYIDWTPFFQTWMLKGKYPNILKDPVIGVEAKKLFDDANKMLDKILADKQLHANAVVGIYPANVVDNDTVQLYTDEARKERKEQFHFLRQQGKKGPGVPNISIADFIAPVESGVKDYFGAFAVTAGEGIEEIVKKYEAEFDDYNSIMVKALADRLAEALAEKMHQWIRKEGWGYAADETLTNEELIKETYSGIRPAPGYPACPDHTEKVQLFDLLDATASTGIILTESLAMYPAAAVSGFYIGQPESKYFGLGKVEKDQVEAYAKRKNMPLPKLEKWLEPNLTYEL